MATNTATSFTDHTGNNTAGPFNISFNYLDQNEVDVIVDGDLKTINDHYTFTTASTISFTNSNFPAQNAKIRFQRDTNISAKKVDFSDGSVLTESDLDLQNNQLLYGLQESIDTITHDYFQLDGSKCLTGNICFEGATTDDNETVFGVTDPTADQTYLLPNLGAGTYAIHTSGSPDIITNIHIASGTIIDDNVAPNADIKGTKIEPEFGSQVIRQKVSGYGMDLYPNCQISFGRTNDISSGMTMKIGPSTIGKYDGNNEQFIDNNINLGHPNLGLPGGLGGWSNEINNSANGHRATILIGRLTMAARKQNHSPNTDGYLLRADGRDGCMFYSPDNSLFGDYENIPGDYTSWSTNYGDSSNKTVAENMDTARDAADFRIINGGAKANNKLEIGSSTTTGTLSLSGKDITSIIINSAAVAHTANDASVFTTSGSDARYFRQDTSETITSGVTWSGDDAHVATTGAIDARIVDLVDDVGGFVPIANETSFPNANPDVNNGAGTLLSVPLANNITSNGSGVISIANGTIGNSTVTINGAANNTTYSTGFGIIVETTSTLNTYTFHRYVPKATEVTTVAGIASDVTTVGGISTNVTTVAGISSNVTTVANAITNVNNVGGSIANVNTCATNLTSINNFADRYQIASSNPSTDGGGNALADGDLYFDTTNNLLKVYNGTAWQGGITATEDLLLKSGDQMTGNLTFSGNQTVDGRDVSVDGTKLDGIAANANNYSISSDLLDEDDMATNSATKVASQQSIKAYVDTADALKASLSGATFTGDVIFDGATAGRDITYDRSADNLIFSNDAKATFGDNNNLEIYSTGSNNFITSSSTNTWIKSTGEQGFANGSEYEIRCTANQGVELFYDGGANPKFETTSTGATVKGNVLLDSSSAEINLKAGVTDTTGSINWTFNTADTNYASINLPYNTRATDGLIIDTGSYNCSIKHGAEYLIKAIGDGAVELYYDNSKKLETVTGGVSVTGDITATGEVICDNVELTGNMCRIKFTDSDNNPDYSLIVNAGVFKIYDITNDANRLVVNTDGHVDITGNLDVGANITLQDDQIIYVGTGNDLQISHIHPNSWIENTNDTGNLYIKSIDARFISHENEDMVKAVGNGAVELYYDGTKKFETTSAGVQYHGIILSGNGWNDDTNQAVQINQYGQLLTKANTATDVAIAVHQGGNQADDRRFKVTVDGSVYIDSDSAKLNIGSGNELQIFHDTHSYIKDATTAHLRIENDNVRIRNGGSSETMIAATVNDNVSLYYDNVKKLETHPSNGVQFPGGLQAPDTQALRLGDSNDLIIYHGSDNNSYIQESGSGSLVIKADDLYIQNAAGSHTNILADSDGKVELSYNGNKRIETSTSGGTFTGNWTFPDSDKLYFGTDNDLELSHNNVNGYILNTSGSLYLMPDSAGYGLALDPNGACKLYWDGDKKLETTSNGISVTGSVIPTGNVNLGDSTTSNNNRFIAGASDDLQIYHSNPNSYVQNTKVDEGNLYIQTDALTCRSETGTENYIVANHNGSVDLYYDNSLRLETFSSGVKTHGQLLTDGSVANDWIAKISHDGGSASYWGVQIACGEDNPTGTNYAMQFTDGDGTNQGYITFSGGTVTYGAFTAHHPCIVPDADNPSDNSNAYPYGTLLETISIEYTQKNGSNTERGIRYKVQKTQSANSKKILGAYGSSMNGGPDGQTNEHQALVLGDGHILVNNAGGNIEIGDGICSSATAGIGQKATANPSMIIGIAQEAVTFTGSETKLVAVQYGLQQFTPWS